MQMEQNFKKMESMIHTSLKKPKKKKAKRVERNHDEDSSSSSSDEDSNEMLVSCILMITITGINNKLIKSICQMTNTNSLF